MTPAMDASEMKKHAREKFAALGIDVEFDADPELASYRRGAPLTMGDLRRLQDGTVVWVHVFYKNSVRADGAFRATRREDSWAFDDGSSFGLDVADRGDDGDRAADEWTTIYAAEKVPP